jgi:exosortase sorting signal-containing protein
MRTWRGLLVALLAFGASSVAAQNLVLNPSFETGDITSWSVAANPACTYEVQAPPVASGGAGNFPAQPPVDGAFALNPDTNNPGVCQIFQDIALPAGSNYVLSFAAGYNYANLGGDPTGAGCSASVDIETTGGVPIATYYAVTGGTNQALANRGSFQLPPGVAGTTVRLAVTMTSCAGGPVGMPADAFVIAAGTLAPVQTPTLSPWSLLLLALALAAMAAFTLRRRIPH